MNAPESNQEIFVQQAAALADARTAGSQAFEDAARRVTLDIVEYPEQVIEADLEHTDSRMAVAYEAALMGLHRAMTDQQLRCDFARVFSEYITPPEAETTAEMATEPLLTSETSTLMSEAFHNSFSEEIETVALNDEFAALLTDSPVVLSDPNMFQSDEEALSLEFAAPDEFRSVIAQIFGQVEAMEKIIKMTNTTDSELVIIREYPGDGNRSHPVTGIMLKLQSDNSRQVIFVNDDAGYCTTFHQESEIVEGEKKIVWKLRVNLADFVGQPDDDGISDYQSVKAYLVDRGENRMIFDESEVIIAANSIFELVSNELAERQMAANATA